MSDKTPAPKTHENVLFPCGGGFANTGLAVYQACYEIVRELGLRKISMGCVGSLPLKNEGVIKKSMAARRIITVDGCANHCAQKLAEAAGLPIAKSLELVRDTGAKKVPLSHDLEAGPKTVDEYILRSDVDAMKNLIRAAIDQA